MVSSSEILAAFREVSNSKQLDRSELYALLQDGILAALAKKYGPNVQAEVNIDDGKGDIRIVLLKTVVANVEDSSREITLEDARTFDDSFEVGDVMEEPIDFAVFGRAAVQAAKQRIIQRVREGERTRIRDEFATRVGDRFSGEVRRSSGKLVIMLNKSAKRKRSFRIASKTTASIITRASRFARSSSASRRRPKGPRLILSRGDRCSCRRCSSSRFRRSSKTSSRFGPRRVKSAAARRSPCSLATTRSIRSARASASRARAFRRSSTS
jgi:N utilization substance protein A